MDNGCIGLGELDNSSTALGSSHSRGTMDTCYTVGLRFFVPALFFSILTPLFLPSSSVSLTYLILVVPMRKCSGKHLCISSTFPISSTFIIHGNHSSIEWILDFFA